MSRRESCETGAEAINKRTFLKQVGASAVALGTVGGAAAADESPSPDYYCETTVVTSKDSGHKCWTRSDQDSFDYVIARFRLREHDDGATGDIGVFGVDDGADNCLAKDMDYTYEIYDDTTTIEHRIDNPSPEIAVGVNPEYNGLVYDIELEQCIE